MSSVSVNVSPSFLPEGVPAFPDKKSRVLAHIAGREQLVDVRPASRLELRPRPEMLPSGVRELDAITGGIPRGCLTEICGLASSGKTSLLLAALAAATRRQEACVLIDASDSFALASAQVAGVDFTKLLWVRCGVSPSRRPVADASREKKRNQIEWRLEQVLKSTDLVLQSGGFGLVALDLAGIPEKFVRRISLASWFRFQRAVENTKTALLVVTETVCAQACATLILNLSAVSHRVSEQPSHALLLERMQVDVEVARERLERKPVKSVKTNFATRAVRAG